jgi:hypothetical protein
MSNLLNICGIVIASSQYPDATLQQFYRQYYHCEIKAEQIKAEVQSPSDLSMFFPYQDTWWPCFTIDQISSESFQSLSITELDPALSCQTSIRLPHYFLLKEAVSQVLFLLCFLKLNNLNILPQSNFFNRYWFTPNGCFCEYGMG